MLNGAISNPSRKARLLGLRRIFHGAAVLLQLISCSTAFSAEERAAQQLSTSIIPILREFCFDCHTDGEAEGGATFDHLLDGTSKADAVEAGDPELWHRVLKQLRSDLMPPLDEVQPSAKQIKLLENWIVQKAFSQPDDQTRSRHVMVRRLNRAEYRNTIKDLLDVDYDTLTNFPPDDSGEGFDNMAQVLTVSPLLLEKYIEAAKVVVQKAIPIRGRDSDWPDEETKETYQSIFPREIPESNQERIEYAREILGAFTFRAFRRTVDESTVQRLVDMAQSIWELDGKAFEEGVSQAMIAVLSSPRFLFRDESHSNAEGALDEFALASRLSYFLWSSMPDQQLLDLADQGLLRANLADEIDRMKQHDRFQAFYRDFVGQWLRTRDVDATEINPFSVYLREYADAELREEWERVADRDSDDEDAGDRSKELTEDDERIRRQLGRKIYHASRQLVVKPPLRKAMRLETEMMFDYILNEGRDLAELIDCDYTFLNEDLAKHYGIEGVTGDQMRKVDLPESSLRGGILANASMLMITSNPDRTSPVKRGVFILDNLLGMPTGAPPADIPGLEESEVDDDGSHVSLRKALSIHRESALCSSCHNRMDPLGLALENFDPLGRQRKEAVDVSDRLVSGEPFSDLQELKSILAKNHRTELYRCAAEKMLIYALGRSLSYRDVVTVDAIVARIQKSGGRASELLMAVIESPAFQGESVQKTAVSRTAVSP